MKLTIKRVMSIMVIAFILTGLFFPSIQPVYAAAGNNEFTPTFAYSQEVGRWVIEWQPIDGAKTVSFQWHNPDGTFQVRSEIPLVLEGGKNRIYMDFQPDHIYDLTFSFENEAAEAILFQNEYNVWVTQETVFFLSDITFEGTSFNEMAVLGGLADGNPNLIKSEDETQVIRIISGQEPQMTLRWKVPTIWEPDTGEILHITNKDVNLNRLESSKTPHVDIDFSYFHIKMNEVQDVITTKEYRTGYSNTNQVIIRETGKEVSGFDSLGKVTTDDQFVSYTLDQTNGIRPGTEYEKINIRLYFWNETVNEQAIFSRLKYGHQGGGGFPIENKDNIFQTIEGRIDSMFTPMMYEMSKVDVNKLEIRIYKIKSEHYTKLYYEVQSAGTIIELLEGAADTNTGIKVPDDSIPGSTGWASVIIDIPLDQNGQHPEHYYRVVVTDDNAHTPLGSLAIDLRTLGNDTGKPPVPREIQVKPEYNLKQDVVYYNHDPAGEMIKIPSTNLRISFEKPLLWMTQPWGDIQTAPDDDNDFTFHILLNTLLTDDAKLVETKTIGDQEVTVFVPVIEKRVLTFDKHDLHEDRNDSRRLVYELDGTDLFYDFAANAAIDFENNVDMDGNDRADYPSFLLPNTMYYLRMFSTRRKDNSTVNWAAREGLDDKISYISPVVSFTTYPTQDLPVPLPNLTIEPDIEPEPDPDSGKPIFNGVKVSFPKILEGNDWLEYTKATENRRIVYDLYISDSTDSFQRLEPPNIQIIESSSMDRLETLYPDEHPDRGISCLVTHFPNGEQGEPLKPNTTYYFKLQAKLYVNNEEEPFLISDETPIKSITTPKTDSGSMDDLDRKPRTPVEFTIATGENGELELTDARVTLNWLHAENDVTYEMVCTKERLDNDYDYTRDDYHIGNSRDPGFLDVYGKYKPTPSDKELHIDVIHTDLKEIGFTYNEGNSKVARFPVNLPFLKPNHLYYFSLRAVRNRGQEDVAYSDWVSIPVTTRMVKPPDFLEAVNDVQLGFKVRPLGNIKAEDIRVSLKKGYQKDASYVELSKAKYSVVKDNRDYYIRLYDLEPDTWYDIQLFYNSGNTTMWYYSENEDWYKTRRDPIQLKTRDTLNEIEVRFSGEEDLYEYFLEIRNDDDEDYRVLQYDRDPKDSDYGYTLFDGTRVAFYREKINSYIGRGMENKYVYYAKISNVRYRRSDGTYERRPLLSNTRYYIKVWARNIEDSAHIGPVTVRTDFSQDDYDKGHLVDEITDMFNNKADGLTRKLYFTIDELDKTANRVLVKGAMVSSMLKVSGYSSVLIDISNEKPGVSKDVILIPMEVLSTLQETSGRLTLKLSGGELTLTGESVKTDELLQQAATIQMKEAMLQLTVDRKKDTTVEPPWGLSLGSAVFDVEMHAVGMKRTYTEINKIIYDILKEPDATGPFKYGILERELLKLLEKETTLTYQSQVELDGLISSIIDRVEEELSLYIKDILDGGRGFSASVVSRKAISELSGGLKLKMLHDGFQALAEPKFLPSGGSSWQEPRGIKAWMYPYVLVTCKTPGQYAVFLVPSLAIPEEDGFIDPDLKRLAQKYNLQKVFGGKNLYPGDHVSRDSAVSLFEVITETSAETAGLSTAAKVRYYKLEDILPVSVIHDINRAQAVCLVIEIYAHKTGISADDMRPVVYRYIKDSTAMEEPIYHRLVIAVDLGVASLEPDGSFKGENPATVEELLKEVIKVLELLGEW